MPEPYVLKGTRTVPRRGEMSNHLFLFNQKGEHMMLWKEFSIMLKMEIGVGYLKAILNRVSIH